MDEEIQTSNSSTTKSIVEEVEEIKYTVLKYLDNIANCLNDEELSKDYTKKDGKINWQKMREIMRKDISSEFKEDWENMWKEEDLSTKLVTLKTLSMNAQSSKKAWRPETGNIKPQIMSLERKKLLDEIENLKKMRKEKEEQGNMLKSKLTEEWNQIKDIRQKILDHKKSMSQIQEAMNDEFEKHYQSELFTFESIDELKKDIQNTTLQGCLNDVS